MTIGGMRQCPLQRYDQRIAPLMTKVSDGCRQGFCRLASNDNSLFVAVRSVGNEGQLRAKTSTSDLERTSDFNKVAHR